ncbi:MAG: holo-ACP synthase [Epulopiscium sp.]|jgi:holo-[acyl-carrier protein] synthase|nr:holo-ACP synthase [Candidatus Epulonipiscium sp.]
MVIGIGTDIIEIKRIKEAVTKNPRFIEKCFTVNEQEFFNNKKNSFQSIAGTFAAKEAVSKALGTGFTIFELKDIEILRDKNGKPYVYLYNKAKETSDKLNISKILVTISHSREYAVAYALAQD